mgnify:CR=1 FL=1
MYDNGKTFLGFSLVDITPTGVIRSHESDNLQRNQQRNWETVLQCIGLRTQPLQIQNPSECLVTDLKLLKFGDLYQGQQQKVWIWTWATEAADIYDLNGQELAGLLKDFEQVPIIAGLTETARFLLPIFYPHGPIKNIYFKAERRNR